MTKSIRRNHTSAFTATVGRIDLRDEQTRRLERIAELLYSGAMPFETASTVDSAPPYARSGELTPETIFSGGACSMASTSQAGDRAMARRIHDWHPDDPLMGSLMRRRPPRSEREMIRRETVARMIQHMNRAHVGGETPWPEDRHRLRRWRSQADGLGSILAVVIALPIFVGITIVMAYMAGWLGPHPFR